MKPIIRTGPNGRAGSAQLVARNGVPVPPEKRFRIRYRETLPWGIDLLFIASLWIISLSISNPFGNFPLNDDWSFGMTVNRFLETGDFRPIGWTSMPLITHVLWGSLFCIPYGFSFDALRLSTLVISLGGVVGVYFLIQEVNGSRWLAVIVALTTAFNPIYYALSNTFMTDVPFTATIILAVLFLTRSLQRDSDFNLLAGSLFLVAATLNRQLGIAVSLAFTVAFLLKNGVTRRSLARAALPAVCCIGALLLFEQWLAATDRLPALYSAKSEALLMALSGPQVAFSVSKNAYVALLYVGWFLSPVLAFVFGRMWFRRKGRTEARLPLMIPAAAALLLLSLILWHQSFPLMPLGGNILNATGIGPLTLRDTFILNAPHVPPLPASLWFAITLLSLCGGALVITSAGTIAMEIWPALRPAGMNGRQAVSIFVLMSAGVYLLPLAVHGFFDRYLIAAVPLLAAGMASVSAQNNAPHLRAGDRLFPVVASVLVGLFVVFTISSTRDYLTWNRTRWLALNDLMESGRAKAEEIDGGFEFNGLHLYRSDYPLEPDKSWWWVDGDTYVIAFGVVPGYSVIREYSYSQWMPPRSGSIVVLEKRCPGGTTSSPALPGYP